MKKALLICLVCLVFVFWLLGSRVIKTDELKTISYAVKTDEIKTISYERRVIIGDYLVTVTGSGLTKEVAYEQAKAMIDWARVGLTKDDLDRLAKEGISLSACFLCTEPNHGEAELHVAYGYVIDEIIYRGESLYWIIATGSGLTKEVAYEQAKAMIEWARVGLTKDDLDRLAKEGISLSVCFLCTEPNHGEAELHVIYVYEV